LLALPRPSEYLRDVPVRRAKVCVLSGCKSHPATCAPAGSNRSSRGGNEATEAFDGKGRASGSASESAVTTVNAIEASKTEMREPTPLAWEEGCHPPDQSGRTPCAVLSARRPEDPAGVEATAGSYTGRQATRETPTVAARRQPEVREGQIGPCGVAERSVVPWKPGNAGGGKGPQFQG
jgi:hypothetical protein